MDIHVHMETLHEDTHTEEKMRAETGVSNEGAVTTKGVWPSRHLEFELLASSTMKESIFVLLSHPICGTL